MTARDPHAPDRAVSHALDHFSNRYYELMKAASAVITAYDLSDDRMTNDLDAAIEALRTRLVSK